MSLPSKNEKEYLAVTESGTGLTIVGQKTHVDDLDALFRQYGLRCRRDAEVRPGEDALSFPWGEDRAQIENILGGYKDAKGS